MKEMEDKDTHMVSELSAEVIDLFDVSPSATPLNPSSTPTITSFDFNHLR